MKFEPAQAFPPPFPRPRLVEAALSSHAPVVVLAASAGMGKTAALEAIAARLKLKVHRGRAPPPPDPDAPVALWDIPPGVKPQALPEPGAVGGRLIVAKRPDTRLPGLERALAYGRALVLGDDELRFSEADLAPYLGAARAAAISARTDGWPALVAACLASPEAEAQAAAFCLSERLSGESDEALAARAAVFHAHRPLAPAYREIAASALAAEIARRAKEPARARNLADAFARVGRAPQAVTALQAAGLEDEALAVFAAAGGWCFIYHYGAEAFDQALAGFTEPLRQRSETLTLALACQALKKGDVPRARKLFANRFGSESQDPARVYSSQSRYTPPVRLFYFVMMLYGEPIPSDALIEAAFATLDEMPLEGHLPRGNVYNAGLEFMIRESRFAEAEDLARRSLYHYERANVPILSFYICVHMTVIRLTLGDLETARAHGESARAWLDRTPFESVGDRRILALLDACVLYEGGQAEALMNFLLRDLDEFAQGETWPSLLELAIHYGAQALADHYSTRAALAFVDRWRPRLVKYRGLSQAIELRTVAVLQSANRWDDAEAALGGPWMRVSRDRLLSGVIELGRLRDREALNGALAWMRQIAYRAPKTPGLERRLAALRDNLALTPRQRVGVEIWLAFVQRGRRDLGRARTGLRAALEAAAQSGSLAPIASERIFLAELLAQRQIVDFVESSPQARQALRKLADIGFSPTPAAGRLGLTRQETKLLLMACRGATNKDAAKALGLSQATVKFHLGNAYRKLGCRRRAEATAAAYALGIVR